MMRCASLLAAFLLLGHGPALAGDVMDDAAVYGLAVDSVAWIAAVNGEDQSATVGTGVLIDAGRGYVLTADHVAREREASVFFPARTADGELIADPNHYLGNAGQLGIRAEVVDRCAERDLALLRLRAPTKARAMPIAARSPRPGQPVFAIGNRLGREDERPEESRLAGAMWGFSGGHVRQVYALQRLTTSDAVISGRVVDATVVIGRGDSGGPLVNSLGELTGLTIAGGSADRPMYLYVDVAEIWAFLRRRDLSVTLNDPRRSVFAGRNSTLAFRVFFAPGGKDEYTVTHRYSVTVGADGRASVSPLMAVAAAPPEPADGGGRFKNPGE